MLDLDLNLLPVLLALHDERNVTRAARRLGISQPAASVALSKLRASFKDPLFLKTGSGIEPTPRADALAVAAREILSHVERTMSANTDFDPSRTEKPFVFALSETGEAFFLPRLVENLQKLAPNAPIRSVFRHSSEVGNAMATGEVDLAIGAILEDQLTKNAFCQQQLTVSDMVCVVRAGYPISSRRLTLKQYLGLRHILVRLGQTNSLLERSLGPAGTERKIVLITSHSFSLPFLLERTDLAATVNRPLAENFLRSGAKLKILDLPSEVPPASVKQVWHRRYHDDPRNKWLRSLVRRLFTNYH
jgi:DNA-binding transcriptional LysR family regulator